MKLTLALAILAGPALPVYSQSAPVEALADPSIFSCFPLGGQGKACITKTGTLRSFKSQDGQEHLAHGTIMEGYGIEFEDCTGLIATSYDFGPGTNEGWSAPVISQPGGPNTLPLTITRKSFKLTNTDHYCQLGTYQFELKQVFSRDVKDGYLQIDMALKSIGTSKTALGGFCRQADIDVEGEAGKFVSPFMADDTEAIAMSNVSGMGMRYSGAGLPGKAGVFEDSGVVQHPCFYRFGSGDWPRPGLFSVIDEYGHQTFDGTAGALWSLPYAPGVTTNMRVQYKGY